MSALAVFVPCILLLWAAAIWALHIEFRALRHRERDLPEAERGPAIDAAHVAFWQSRGAPPPAPAALPCHQHRGVS